MVLDGRVRRRQLLGAAAGLATLTGCGLFDDEPAPVPPPDALQPVLDEALALAAAYDRAVTADPGLFATLAGNHRSHATELARLIGATLPPSAPAASSPPAASSSSGGEAAAELRKKELAAQKTATAAVRATTTERAALVGSIAAARAAHAEALQ